MSFDSSSNSSPSVAASLANALVSASLLSDPGNVQTNKRLWNEYASNWSADEPWVQSLASEAGNGGELRYVGDGWSSCKELDEVVTDFISPYLSARGGIVADVGCGGGRVASKVVGRARVLHCFDISEEMLSVCRKSMSEHDNVATHLRAGVPARRSVDVEKHRGY